MLVALVTPLYPLSDESSTSTSAIAICDDTGLVKECIFEIKVFHTDTSSYRFNASMFQKHGKAKESEDI